MSCLSCIANSGYLQKIYNLFTRGNFCFATVDKVKGRSPTFYFAKGGCSKLNTAKFSGRLRTDHKSGSLIEIATSQKGHLFIPPSAGNKPKKIYKNMRRTIRDIRDDSNRSDQQKLSDMRQQMNYYEHIYDTDPKAGYYHYEYTPDMKWRHPSGGSVELDPRPSQLKIVKLIKRLLVESCLLKVDGVEISPKGCCPLPGCIPRRRPKYKPIPDVGRYLNSLK